VFTGWVTAYLFYLAAFASTWCFFAAVGSAMLLFHFERARRQVRAELSAQV